MIKFRIVCRNNADTRKFSALAHLYVAPPRHNGGKVMIAIVSPTMVEAVETALEASAQVASFTSEVVDDG